VELERIAKEKTADIPEEPYLMLTKPTREVGLTSKTVDEQIAEIVERNKERKSENKPVEFSMMPPEFAAMQMFFTARAGRLKDKDRKLLFEKFEPLDWKYFIRFVSMHKSVRGAVPVGLWVPEDCHMAFSNGRVMGYSSSGVRLVVRIF